MVMAGGSLKPASAQGTKHPLHCTKHPLQWSAEEGNLALELPPHCQPSALSSQIWIQWRALADRLMKIFTVNLVN